MDDDVERVVQYLSALSDNYFKDWRSTILFHQHPDVPAQFRRDRVLRSVVFRSRSEIGYSEESLF